MVRVVRAPCIVGSSPWTAAATTAPAPACGPDDDGDDAHPSQSTTSGALVVPTNPFLTSTSRFAYFQRGGEAQTRPLPHKSMASTSWGGMDAGPNLV